MKLYNTPLKTEEVFKPRNRNEVTIYTCGPTVYSAPHIGNFAAYIYWDLLLRTLIANGYTPKRVINLTDVGHLTSDEDSGEDKMEKGAKREGKTVWEIAEHYINLFKTDFKKLKLLEPQKWARATDYIEESKSLVKKLIDNDYLYETSDGLYFDTSKFPAYKDFAHLDLDHQKAGARVSFSSEKKNLSDFAVWKFIKPGETHAMRWDFLGRPGYPGWHLECSTIIHEELGEPIDIHTGGIDHIPVHHTNEIAQTFGAFHKKLAEFWLHCNFLTIEGEKISKSLGNIITLENLEEKGFSVFDFKLWLYQGHYRSERNFTWQDLEAAKNRRLKWCNQVIKLYQNSRILSAEQTSEKWSVSNLKNQGSPEKNRADDFCSQLLSSLNSDLNSAAAFSTIDSALERLSLEDWQYVDSLFNIDILSKDLTPEIKPEIEKRNAARAKKDFQTADKIRNELLKKGIILVDTENDTIWQLA